MHPSAAPLRPRSPRRGLRALVPALCALASGCGDGAPPASGSGEAAPALGAAPQARAASAEPDLELAGAPPAALGPEVGLGLPDEARERGLDYVNRSGEPSKATILEANGAGVALLDLESDGDLDVVFAQGLASLAALLEGPGADLEVFLNDGRAHFARAPGPGLSGWWTGLATGDVDGDGDCDLVAGGFGSLRILLQDESGALVPGAELVPPGPARLAPGVERAAGQPPAWITSLALFDADRDGHLDLYAGHYLELDPVAPVVGQVGEGALALPCRWKGLSVYCGPHGLVPQPDRLFRGAGDGSFEDRTASWLPGIPPGFTLGVATFDSDGDGDTDVYVANDSTANLMLVNEIAEHGAFVDYGLVAGVALSQDGAAEAGMGAATGDVNRDGRMDLAVTNFSGEPTALYFGAPVGFTNETYRWGLNAASNALLSWGVHLVDFDGDGWLELFTANGHVYPQADAPHTGTSYGQRDTLWFFGSGHKVLQVEPGDERSILWPKSGTRGSAVGDLDGDLAPELVLARLDGPAALGMNRLGARSSWLEVRCAGPRGAREGAGPHTPADGAGARVVCVTSAPEGSAAIVLVREVQTAVGYQSASAPFATFGLGAAGEYASLSVHWPSGQVSELGPGRANRRLFVREGAGLERAEDL